MQPQYWNRRKTAGSAKAGKPYDAINDIFANGDKYGTECATAMVIVYRALSRIFPEKASIECFPTFI